MSIKLGSYLPYTSYRAQFDVALKSEPVLWRGATLRESLSVTSPNERGSVAFSKSGTIDGFEFVDGLSMHMQVVPAGSATRLHSHSWWHLFFVCSGNGTVRFEDDTTMTHLEAGDLLLVPAWREHAFRNATNEDFVMTVLGNLPQQFRLGNKYAQEPSDAMKTGEAI